MLSQKSLNPNASQDLGVSPQRNKTGEHVLLSDKGNFLSPIFFHNMIHMYHCFS
jgi:hypothetical protein